MSFRKPKSYGAVDHREWSEWLAFHYTALKAIQLPPSLTLSKEHWKDFLQNGYLEWHPESNDGFEFDQLSLEQMAGLLGVLEKSPEFASEPMVSWLRNRVGSTRLITPISTSPQGPTSQDKK